MGRIKDILERTGHITVRQKANVYAGPFVGMLFPAAYFRSIAFPKSETPLQELGYWALGAVVGNIITLGSAYAGLHVGMFESLRLGRIQREKERMENANPLEELAVGIDEQEGATQ